MSDNKEPKLKLVSEDGIHFELYIDGEHVKGIRTLDVHCAYDEPVTHTVEYITKFSE